MLFDSTLRKDLARNFVATLVVILMIVMTISLIRTLGQASKGSINPSEVLLIMGFGMLGQLTTVLALSLFIAIIATFSRMYSESEMVIWLVSGRSVASFVPVVLRFAWPVLLAIVVLALLAVPWSQQQMQDLRDRHSNRNDVERVAPGRFQESAAGQRVFFIDKDSPDQNVGTNVFISARQDELETTTTARQGRVEWRGQDRYLVLEQGEQWMHQLREGQTRWTRFEHYDLLVDGDSPWQNSEMATRQMPSMQLIENPSPVNQGELSWRIGMGLCALNFTLLALPLSAVNPRRGRSYQFGLALLAFVFYYNLLNIGQNWVAAGRYSLPGVLLVLHGGALCLALAWLWVQHRQWSWRHLWPARSGGGLA